MKRPIVAAFAVLFTIAPLAVRADDAASQRMLSALHWRSIGPFVGGRVVAVDGVPGDPPSFYMGAVQGGIWKSTDYGQTWTNISDGKLPVTASSIGAIAVAPSNPKIIYAGTGEADVRQDYDSGDGVYKSTDAGKSWSYAGLRDARMTAKIVVDPRNAGVAYVASMGHVYGPNNERGIYKTSDGGKTWSKVLFTGANTGGIDMAMDPVHPDVLYAAMWQAQRFPWKFVSGGPGSALYKTIDGGAHWRKISSNPGFAKGTLGKLGVSVAASDPRVVYAIVQARDGGVFRSDDAGATWKHVNAEWKLRQRAFYYMTIYADPANPRVAYVPEVDGIFQTKDGGKTFDNVDNDHGDCHIVWIDPRRTSTLLEGCDTGASVTVNGGTSWSTVLNQPTGQFYHVALDDRFPFHVFGAQQDEGAMSIPSAGLGSVAGPGSGLGLRGGIGLIDLKTVALGESTFIAPEPGNPEVTYGAGYYSSMVRFNDVTGQMKNVSPWPRYMTGAPASEEKYRFGWSHPILFSAADPQELLLAGQVVFSSKDKGETWNVISPDLTRNDPRTQGDSGGPVDFDQTGAEVYPDIASLAVSPLDKDLIWSGSADGLVHVTTDHGAHWTDVTPPHLPPWSQITSLEPSHAAKGTAYLTASRYTSDDYHPYLYVTADFGAHWTPLTNGIPNDEYLFAVREDPRKTNVLFAGSRSTVYVSLDAGARWQPLTGNLPGAQMRDLAVDAREGELAVATHGRSFWILDNLALIEALADNASVATGNLRLFAPETAWLTRSYGGDEPPDGPFGQNPAYGASVFFEVPAGYDGKTPLSLSFEDAKGSVIRSFSLHLAKKRKASDKDDDGDANLQRGRALDTLTAVKPGPNLFQWDLRYPPVADAPGFRTLPTDDWPDRADGPTILPGTYAAVLQYGDKRLQVPLAVQLDPRVHPAAGDLEARLSLQQQILGTIDELNRSIATAIGAARRTPAKRAAIDAALSEVVMLDVHSSEADVMHETKVREQLGFLLNSLEGAYARPTAAEYAAYADLKALAAAGEARLQAAEGS